jgi:hypothetical protein
LNPTRAGVTRTRTISDSHSEQRRLSIPPTEFSVETWWFIANIPAGF